MKGILLISIACVLVAGPAAAQLSDSFASWPEGPVRTLLTDEELERYSKLTDDEAAQHFIDIFWLQRDPDLTTRVNEFRFEFEAKVAAADEQFATVQERGALTDRGKVLVVAGVPARRWKEAIGDFLAKVYGESVYGLDPATSASDAQSRMHGISFDHNKGLADVWVYTRDQIPEAVALPKRVDSVLFAFFDPEGRDQFVLERSIDEAKWGLKVLESAPEVYHLHPDLTEAPVFPLLPGAVVATAEQLGWLTAEHASLPDGATMAVYPAVATEDFFPAWLLARLPASAPKADLAVGELLLADGTVEGTFQTPITGVEAAHGTLYELTLPAPVGTSTLKFALAAEGKPVAVDSLEVVVDEVAADQTFITEMFTGAELRELTEFEVGTPFVFGGYHLLVRPGPHYDYTDNLDYFCLVVRPGLSEEGAPNAKLKLKLLFEGEEISSQAYRTVELSEMAPNVYMFGSQLPLSILPKGGEYEFRMTVKDFISGVKRSTDIPIVMPEKKE